jgi:protein transport protein SEC20
VRQGKGLLSRLKRRQLTDKILVYLAFAFFLLVVFYIVKKRLGITFFGLLDFSSTTE